MLRPTSPTTLTLQVLRLLRPSLTSLLPTTSTLAGILWSGRDPGSSSSCTTPSTMGPPSFSILLLNTFSPAAQPRELQGLTKPGCFLWLFSWSEKPGDQCSRVLRICAGQRKKSWESSLQFRSCQPGCNKASCVWSRVSLGGGYSSGLCLWGSPRQEEVRDTEHL